MKKIKSYFKGVVSELRKVSWIKKRELFQSFFSIIVFAAILVLFFALIDFIYSLI